MGIVFLASDHHGLRIRNKQAKIEKWIVLTREILERPVVRHDGEPIDPDSGRVHRALLEAFLAIPGIDVAISYGIDDSDPQGPRLSLPRRIWAEMYQGGYFQYPL